MQTWVVVLSLIERSSFGLFRIVNSSVFPQVKSENFKFKIKLDFIASWGLVWGFQTPNFTRVFEPRANHSGRESKNISGKIEFL